MSVITISEDNKKTFDRKINDLIGTGHKILDASIVFENNEKTYNAILQYDNKQSAELDFKSFMGHYINLRESHSIDKCYPSKLDEKSPQMITLMGKFACEYLEILKESKQSKINLC